MMVERHVIEDAIESLIAILDAMDGDPDAELCVTNLPHDDEGEAEPDLGWSSIGMQPGLCGIGVQRVGTAS